MSKENSQTDWCLELKKEELEQSIFFLRLTDYLRGMRGWMFSYEIIALSKYGSALITS